MGVINGRVLEVKVGYDFGEVIVLSSDDGFEYPLVIFSHPDEGPSAFERIIDSMSIALLKDALVHGLDVAIGTSDTSGMIQSVRLLAR
jgi:hypothetical protein